MPPKKGKAEKKEPPVKTSGVLTRRQSFEAAPVGERTRKRRAFLGPEEKKQPHVWPDPRRGRRGRRARVDNAEAMEVVVEEAVAPEVVGEENPVEEELPKSGEGNAANSDKDKEAKSDEDEVAKSGEEEGPAEKSGEEEGLAAKSGEEEGVAAKSIEEESLAVTSGEGQASSSKGKGKGIQQDEGEKKRTMLIRHCKHSGELFKARAAELKAALQCHGWNVRTDTRIRRGSFEVREVGGAAIIHLMDMKEPYQDFVDLDVEGIVSVAVAL